MLPLALLVLPVAAHGELALSVLGGSEIDASLQLVEAKWFYNQADHLEASAEGHRFQDPVIGFGFVWWFGRDSFFGMFGIGGDAIPSMKVTVGGNEMTLELFSAYFVFRFPWGFPFLHGKLVPYVGLGPAGFYLDGEAAILSGTRENYSLEPDDNEGRLLVRIGLEWVFYGPLAVFFEYRYMGCAATLAETDNVGNETYVRAHLNLRLVCLGLALHL